MRSLAGASNPSGWLRLCWVPDAIPGEGYITSGPSGMESCKKRSGVGLGLPILVFSTQISARRNQHLHLAPVLQNVVGLAQPFPLTLLCLSIIRVSVKLL